jgi:hypothetical protein
MHLRQRWVELVQPLLDEYQILKQIRQIQHEQPSKYDLWMQRLHPISKRRNDLLMDFTFLIYQPNLILIMNFGTKI